MRCAPLLVAAIAGMLWAPGHADGAPDPASIPPASPLAPATQPGRLDSYSDLVSKCREYDRLNGKWTWGTVYTADFRPGRPAEWHPDGESSDQGNNRNPALVQTRLMREDGHDELLFDGSNCNAAFLDIGPKIRGDVAVEMLCKNTGVPRPCDLSIFLGKYHNSPGFQFGSYYNTKAVIFGGTGPLLGPNDPLAQPVNCTGQPQVFVPNQWYHVRLEVRDGVVRGLVDGHEVGKIALSKQFPMDQPNQPMLFTYNSQIVVRELQVEAYARDPHAIDSGAWAKAFGNQTQTDVENQLDGLVHLLADRDPATRDQAERTVSSLGSVVIPALQRSAASDVPELSIRAATILQTLNSVGKPPAQPDRH